MKVVNKKLDIVPYETRSRSSIGTITLSALLDNLSTKDSDLKNIQGYFSSSDDANVLVGIQLLIGIGLSDKISDLEVPFSIENAEAFLKSHEIHGFPKLKSIDILEDTIERSKFEELVGLAHEIVGITINFPNITKLDWINKGVADIPGSGRAMPNLEELDIDDNPLEELPVIFGKLKKLKILRMESCQRLKKLGEGFGGLESLEELSLLLAKSLEKLPDSFGKLKNLKKLNMKRCRQLKDLGESIRGLENLEELYAGDSNISDEEIEKIKQALPYCNVVG